MAIQLYLGIDCGTSRHAVAALAAHFHGFQFPLPDLGNVECDVRATPEAEYCSVAVLPRGMGYGIPGYCRPELVPHENAVRTRLYQHLSLATGFRRAIFCWDPCEFLFASAEEYQDIDYPHMIYAHREFPIPPRGRNMQIFSAGYTLVSPDDDRDA